MNKYTADSQITGTHRATHPLPPPVSNHRKVVDCCPEDGLDLLLKQWVEELRFGNTQDGD